MLQRPSSVFGSDGMAKEEEAHLCEEDVVMMQSALQRLCCILACTRFNEKLESRIQQKSWIKDAPRESVKKNIIYMRRSVSYQKLAASVIPIMLAIRDTNNMLSAVEDYETMNKYTVSHSCHFICSTLCSSHLNLGKKLFDSFNTICCQQLIFNHLSSFSIIIKLKESKLLQT